MFCLAKQIRLCRQCKKVEKPTLELLMHWYVKLRSVKVFSSFIKKILLYEIIFLEIGQTSCYRQPF